LKSLEDEAEAVDHEDKGKPNEQVSQRYKIACARHSRMTDGKHPPTNHRYK